jgi:hypothetical protein
MRNLDRDSAAVLRIGGAKYRSHAAAGNEIFNAIVVEEIACVKCGHEGGL